MTADPTDLTVNLGNVATFTALASGNPTPTIVWQKSVGGGPFATIPEANATTFSFTPTAADNGDQFRAIFTNSLGSVTSGNATLTVVNVSSNNADSGPGSLRHALLNANNSPGSPHTIQFQLAPGSQTIILQTALPTTDGPLTLSLDATQKIMLILSAGDVWTDNQSLTISGAGSFNVSGGIEGAGDLSVGAGGNLTATQIIQGALAIGGTAGSPANVTIAATDGAGNSLPNAAVPSTSGGSAFVSTTVNWRATASNSVGEGSSGSVARQSPRSGSMLPKPTSHPPTLNDPHADLVNDFLATLSGADVGPISPVNRLSFGGGQTAERGIGSSCSDASPSGPTASGKLASLEATFASDSVYVNDLSRREWLGAEMQTLGDDSSAIALTDDVFESLATDFGRSR